MSTEIRRADLTADRALIIESLHQWLTKESSSARYDWLYLTNPAGEARVWIGTDRTAGVPVGLAAAFPRLMLVGGVEVKAWVLGDFCINPAYRSLGPALQLQRACLTIADGDEPSFCYDFPNSGMVAVYRRLGIKPFGEMIRMARPLRVDAHVRNALDVPGLTTALSAAGNLALDLRDAVMAHDRNVQISLHEDSCGDEFSELGQQAAAQAHVSVLRSSQYLNWRYLAATYCRFELLTARRGRTLLAYAVFTCPDDKAILVDMVGPTEPRVLGKLINVLARILRKRGASTLSAPIWGAHPWLPIIKATGFWPRETTPVFLHCPNPPAGFDAHRQDWLLWHGDRDS